MVERRIGCDRALLGDGWQEDVCLDLDAAGMITKVSRGRAKDTSLRLRGSVIPGMPNLHSHGFQHLVAGLTGVTPGVEDDFWSWRQAMYQLAALIGPEEFQDCLTWVYVQMLRAGFTSCAEFHYLHHQPKGHRYPEKAEMSGRVLGAAAAAGMPVTLLPVLYERSGFGSESVGPHQLRFHHDLDAYLGLLDDCRGLLRTHPNCRLGAAPHSLRAVAPATLTRLTESLPPGWPLHLHIAEQPAEVRDCREALGARPVEWLLANAPVDNHWCLVHATHMNEHEQADAAAQGAVAGLCPTTEADLGDGFFETDQWLKAGGSFGIGSDSNVRISVSEELRLLEYVERLRQGRRNVLVQDGRSCGESLYTQAAQAGARAIGQGTGRLEVGVRADLIELDTDHSLLQGRTPDRLLDTWVFAGNEDMIRSVWVAGQCVITGGHHADEEKLEAAFRKTMQGILAR